MLQVFQNIGRFGCQNQSNLHSPDMPASGIVEGKGFCHISPIRSVVLVVGFEIPPSLILGLVSKKGMFVLPLCLHIKVWCYECQAYVDHVPLWQFESLKVGRNVPERRLQEPVVDLLATGRTLAHIKGIPIRKRLPCWSCWFDVSWYFMWLCIDYPMFTLFSCKFLKRANFCQSSMCNCGRPNRNRHFIE